MATTAKISDVYNFNIASVSSVLDEFKQDILMNKFLMNKEFLLENSEEVLFNKDSWVMRPEAFCGDYYGESYMYLTPVILLVNEIPNRFLFRPENLPNEKIKAPSLNSILSVI